MRKRVYLGIFAAALTVIFGAIFVHEVRSSAQEKMAETVEIKIDNFAFGPGPATISSGN